MGYFSATAKAYAASRAVRATMLAFFDFRSNPLRVHPGFGDLLADGHVWSGVGQLGSVSGLESALAGSAPKTTFVLSGVDPALIATALAASDEVKNRRATVSLQFFDADTLATLDAPYVLATLLMDVMTIKSAGAATRSVELTAETIWTRQDVAPWGYLSDVSQQARFPGDNGLDQVPLMQNKSVNWPVFTAS